jgi:ABC-2 type transport system permease protein
MITKELHSYFSSPIGYLVIVLFLIFNGLFLFVFKTDFNIFNAGFADLNSFFYLSPWLFVLLIPALTMRSFSDEIQAGTIEILKTKPISDWQIVLSKFLSSLTLIFIMLLLSLSYVYTVYQLGNPIGNINFASTFGSYLGLLLIASSFISIGLFTSTLSNNQIIAFLLAVFVSFLLFYGFEFISDFSNNANLLIKNLGMFEHFTRISKGVIDTRDLIYFGSLTTFFLVLTRFKVERL